MNPKTIIYLILVFSLISCKKNKEKIEDNSIQIIAKKPQKIKRDIDFITDSIIKSIQTNPKTEIDSFVRSKVKFRQFTISNSINRWTYNTEFYQNGILKEKGLYLNGWSFGKWFEYNKNGEIISEIDYSNGQIVKGKKLNYEIMFEKFKSESDSLLVKRFGNEFFQEHIRLNLDRTMWYTSTSSGSITEQGNSRPEKFLFRYSIVQNDTIIITPIEIRFEKESNFTMIQKDGIPDEHYDFKIDYENAKRIANENGFGLKKHNNEFSRYEHLDFYYLQNFQTYFWSISDIPETSYSETEQGQIRKGIGKSLYINSKTGEVRIDDYAGKIIYD